MVHLVDLDNPPALSLFRTDVEAGVCERGCGLEGSKAYASAGEAARYATALDRDDARDLGRRAPLSLFPLRLTRRR